MPRLPALLIAALTALPLFATHASAAPSPDGSSRVRAGGDISLLCVSRSGDRVRLPSGAGECAAGQKTLLLRPSRRRTLCLAADAVRRVGPGRCDTLGGVFRRVPSRKPVVLCAVRGRSLTRVTSRCGADDRWTIRNHAPADLSLQSNLLAAPVAPGALVGAMSVVEVDRADHVRYSLVEGPGGEDNTRFDLDGSLLRTRSALPAGSYSLRVRARDLLGRRTVGVFVVTVTGA